MARGKFEYWLTENGLTLLEGWARDGLTDEQIAHNAGITAKTLYEWKKRFGEISEALKKGKEIVDIQVENALLKRALGYDFQEERVERSDKDGVKVMKTIKHIPPDTTAQIFWLKNRRPDKWRDRPEEKRKVDESSTQGANSMFGIVSPAFIEPYQSMKNGGIQELVLKGGRGSAKSSFISVALLEQLQKYPECHAVVLRKVGNTLRTSVYAQICWAIAELGLANKFKCTVSPMECTNTDTGQKILFFGLDDPGKLKSIKVPFGYIGLVWFEELDQFDGPEQVRNVEQSLFRGGPYSFCFKSFNPPAMARNWANKYVRDKEYMRDDRLVHHSTYQTTPAEWLGPRFLADAEHLRQTNETAYRHEYLGEVVGSGTAVFENLRMGPITDRQIADFDYHYFGQDWGWYPDPNHFSGCAYDSGARTLYIYEEFRGLRQPNAAWSEKIKHHMDDLILADPGSGGDRNVADFRAYGFRMREARKGPGSVAYGIKWLQSLAAIVIDPERCPETAKEFSEYEYERDPKTGEVLEGYPDAANHSIDAVRYAMEPVWRRRGQ